MYKLNNKITSMFSSPEGNDAYNIILYTIEKYGMTEQLDSGVLVGFSGGPDSVFLVSFLKEYVRRTNKNIPILCVHVNHGIRDVEAKRDEIFSLDFARELSIECTSVTINVPDIAKKQGIGIEETARNERYAVFERILSSRNDFSTIVIAHNATDNMETVIFNILRGSGSLGAAGIKPVRENIIRPLIKISKPDILTLLNKFEIPYVTDSTNLSSDYSRNYIRNEILPKFERLSSSPEVSFSKLTDNLLSDVDYFNQEAEKIVNTIDLDNIKVSVLRNLHPALRTRVINKIVHRKCNVHLEEKHIRTLFALLEKDNFAFSIPGEYDFVCERGICFFSSKIPQKFDESMIFPLTYGENKIQSTNLTVYIGDYEKTSSNVYNFSIHADIASAIINNGLILRLKQDGDSYKYSGITHKLKKVFNDRNIPPHQRSRIAFVCDKDGIVWVPGLSVRDDALPYKNDSVRITFCYSLPTVDEIEMFTALMRNNEAISSKERL